MIGRRIEAQRGLPWGAALLGLVGLGLLGAGVAQGNANLAVGSALPLALAVALVLGREPDFAATFEEEGLRVDDPPLPDPVPYDSVEWIVADRGRFDLERRGRRAYPILIGHREGVLRIPARVGVASDEVLRFLLERCPPSGSRDVHADLAEYLARQRSEFGDERVWSFRVAPKRPGAPRPRLRAVCAGAFVAGLIWIAYAALDIRERGGWAGAGTPLAVFGLLFWLASFAEGRVGRFKGWESSSLVIGPLGLALVQGDLRGELRWDELRDVRLGGHHAFQLSAAGQAVTGLVLRVHGADVVLPDIYDRPLGVIHRQILAYWR